ncbi:MAG TPA: hypothetical protein PLQ13_11695, partial [Candidatus Krumholzibacteria bacterium]|nr:hypothetical protein [Candidatus Krumholzibacteria bacterium]
MTTKTILAILALAALATAAAPAAASHWCGENGLIRFSFAEGDTLVPVAHVEPDQDGVTRVTLQVWLTDVEPMAHDGEALLGVGGFELALEVEGGEVFIADRIFPSMAMNVAKDEWGIVTGLNPNPRLEDGRALLVTYKLMFMGRPENVRFGIRPEGLYSCPTVDGCAGSGTRAQPS